MAEKNTQIRLGIVARNLLSNMEGILESRTELMNGTIQYAMQPTYDYKGMKLPDGYNHDHQVLEYVNDGISDRVIQAPEVPIRAIRLKTLLLVLLGLPSQELHT